MMTMHEVYLFIIGYCAYCHDSDWTTIDGETYREQVERESLLKCAVLVILKNLYIQHGFGWNKYNPV